MTYLERQTEINEKVNIHIVGLRECQLEMNELIYDMANRIENQQEHIDSLEDELSRLREEKYLKDAY